MVTKIKRRLYTSKITERGKEAAKWLTHTGIGVLFEADEGTSWQDRIRSYILLSRTKGDRRRDIEIETDCEFLYGMAGFCGAVPEDTKEEGQRKMEELLVQIRDGIITGIEISKRLR